MILERINNNYDSISSEEILNNNLKTRSIEVTESSLNIEDLDSIRFFDKINMKRNSFSNTKIPTLNFLKEYNKLILDKNLEIAKK